MTSYNANLFNVPRPRDRPPQIGNQRVVPLPLNLIALIISHLDDVADLARVCQTSRVLHYMTLPQLYRNITLTSYNTIRYKDERPEGCGSASPFSMGLNALVTRSVANLVRSLSLQGEWREHDLQEFSQAGRVPDDAMMLNIAVRAAIDRCVGLETFSWNLSTKLLSTVYLGLTALPHLANLHLRFPSSRSPRPTILIPAMPHLRSLTVTHIDPLAYPDDISTLLFGSKKLRELRIHWSPRMRDVGEPSIHLQSYFRRNIAAKQKLKLKIVGFYNLFALHTPEIHDALDDSETETVTLLNCFGADDDRSHHHPGSSTPSGLLTFLDDSWIRPPKGLVRLKTMRHDVLNRGHCEFLGSFSGMEHLYLINARHTPSTHNGRQQVSRSPASAATSTPSENATPDGLRPYAPNTSLRDAYLDNIITNHGSTLRHLLLPDRWPLPITVVSRLFRGCPNLTQLAMAFEFASFESFRMLLPFLKKIRVMRLLVPTTGSETADKTFHNLVELPDELHEEKMGEELAKEDFPYLKYVGLGWKVFEVAGWHEKATVDDEGVERMVKRRRITRVEMSAVKDVEIWKMDSMDVI